MGDFPRSEGRSRWLLCPARLVHLTNDCLAQFAPSHPGSSTRSFCDSASPLPPSRDLHPNANKWLSRRAALLSDSCPSARGFLLAFLPQKDPSLCRLASDGRFFIFMFWYCYRGLQPHLQCAHAENTEDASSDGDNLCFFRLSIFSTGFS
jgi:hypothetical protein